MQLTRQGWGVVALVGVTGVLAVALDRPLALVGPVGVIAWFLARQWLFVTSVTRTLEGLSATRTTEPTRLTADDRVEVSFTVSLPESTPVRVTVEETPPVGTTGASPADRRVTLSSGTTETQTTYTLTCPVAGRHTFDAPKLTVEDDRGLFRSVVSAAPSVRAAPDGDQVLTVEPNAPRQVHVGAGGERIGAFGQHRTDQVGEGIDPAELREYQPGDPADRLDWKATARLNDPHVREFEVGTDLQTVLAVDCRASMAEGASGRTKLDYLREVALTRLAALRSDGEAVGLYVVGDDGLVHRTPPATGPDQYARIREQLLSLSPTDGSRPSADGPTTDARRLAGELAADDTQFGRTLEPFLADTKPYVQRVSDEPLYRIVRSAIATRQAPQVVELYTDDSRPAELQEATRAASRGTDRVAAYLAPSVLFESAGLADIERAYGRYGEFERLRRRIAARNGVDAYEVGPADRVLTLTGTGRRRAR